MVESFSSSDSGSTTTTDSNTATYAGIMVSVFTLGEFIMATQWARISDRIGRKPTLFVGSVGAMISAIVFGFSNSLPMAIAARTFAGLANPNLGIVKTFVGELVRKDHQGKMCHGMYSANSLRES
jgi:MFS family permease